MKKRVVFDFLIPLFILTGMTAVFWLTNADITIQNLFYDPGKGWYLKDSGPWDFLYRYANIPGLVMGFAALLALVFSFFWVKILPYRKIALFLILFLAIGPGLITNTIFKNRWGRPRPSQIEIFGGKSKYLPVWVKGISGNRKSFPSGHASIGFFVFAPFFFLRHGARKWARLSLALGICFGLFVGVGRMIQGGHFASDVLWSFGFIYLTGLILYYIFGFDRQVLSIVKEELKRGERKGREV